MAWSHRGRLCVAAGLLLLACSGPPRPAVPAGTIEGAIEVEIEVEVDLTDLGTARAWLPIAPHDPSPREALRELTVHQIRPALRGGRRGVEVHYQIDRAALGEAGPDTLYTAFHTSRWMPTKLHPSRAQTLVLSLRHPERWVVAGTGRREPIAPGRTRFRLERAHPSYLFGFVAGAGLRRAVRGRGPLTYELVHPGFTERELDTLVDKAHAAMTVFAEIAGRDADVDQITLTWLEASVAQEVAHGAIMSADEARTMLADPNEDWLLVHELAHQFWGNRVRAATWSEFWLNEGFATYMTAVFKERTQGRDAYDREVSLARARLGRLREAGRDRPLVGDSSTTVENAGGPLVYSKGMLLLHALREAMGDAAFFAGVARYTRSQWDRGTRTEALLAALQAETDTPLRPLFVDFGAAGASDARRAARAE